MRTWWKPEEEAILRQLYPSNSLPELEEALKSRTLTAILYKAWTLGLKRRYARQTWSHWKDYELKLLQENYPQKTLAELAVLLPRHTNISIGDKLREMNLPKHPKSIRLARSLNEFEKGLIIGLIEGEGALMLMVRNRRLKMRNINITIEPLLQISNTDHDLLIKAEEILGCGTVDVCRTRHKIKNHKTVYAWRTNSRKVIASVLKELSGHWVSYRKGHTADLLLEYCLIRDRILKHKSNLGVHDEREYEIAKEVLELNKRGLGPLKSFKYLLLR